MTRCHVCGESLVRLLYTNLPGEGKRYFCEQHYPDWAAKMQTGSNEEEKSTSEQLVAAQWYGRVLAEALERQAQLTWGVGVLALLVGGGFGYLVGAGML